MLSTFSQNILGQFKASVAMVADKKIQLTIGNGDTIELPRHALETDLNVGDTILLELKKNGHSSFENMVNQSQKKMEETKKQEQMRRLLEELIN